MATVDTLQPTEAKYEEMENMLCNTSGSVPLSERFRILFTLKNIPNDRSVEIIGKGRQYCNRSNTVSTLCLLSIS